jgi:drug/metabolite transporter (DMT)-like permease
MAPLDMISATDTETAGGVATARATSQTYHARYTRQARLRIYLVLAFGIVCIALSGIFTRLSGVTGTVSAFYRIAITVAALAPLFARQAARRQVPTDRRVWLLAACAGIFFALDLALWNTSLFLTTVANATLLGNDAPIVVGLIALLIFRERLRPAYWLGLALALAGMVIIVGHSGLLPTSIGVGDALALGTGVAYALYLVLTQRVRERMATLPSLWIPGLVGASVLLAFNLAAGRPLWGFSAQAWLMLLLLGLISQLAGWLAINYVLGKLPAFIVSPTLLVQPVLTALFAVPLLDQPLAPRQLLGGAVTLGGIYLVNRGFARR